MKQVVGLLKLSDIARGEGGELISTVYRDRFSHTDEVDEHRCSQPELGTRLSHIYIHT